jgi:hypothetical protein
MYDPEVGVWWGMDPAGQHVNAYVYCGNNPIIVVDPDGRWFGQLLGQMALGATLNSASYLLGGGGELGDRGFWTSAGVGAASGALNFGTQSFLGSITNFAPAVNGFLEIGISAAGTTLIDAGAQSIMNKGVGDINWDRAWKKGAWAGGMTALNVVLNGAMVNPDYFNNQLTRKRTGENGELLTELGLANQKLSKYSGREIDLTKEYMHIRRGGLIKQAQNYYSQNPGVTKNNNNIYMARTGIEAGKGRGPRYQGDLRTYLEECYHRFVSNYAGSDKHSPGLPGAREFPTEILVQ